MPTAQPCAPVVRSPGGKRDHPDEKTIGVGVDAVLSADVGDAPMRQRQYTAPVDGLAFARLRVIHLPQRHASMETVARNEPLIIFHAPCVSPPATTMLISDGSKILMTSSG